MKRTQKVSSKPGKQRRQLHQGHWPQRRKQMSASLSEELQQKYGAKALPVRRGDHVIVVRGQEELTKKSGRVIHVDYKRMRLTIEKVHRRKTDGSALPYPIHPSNVKIVKLAKDKWRTGTQGILSRKGIVEIADDDLVDAPVMKAVEVTEEEDEEE